MTLLLAGTLPEMAQNAEERRRREAHHHGLQTRRIPDEWLVK